MKIIVLDEYIETEDISSISEILKPSTAEFDDSGYSGHDEREWKHRFYIKFYNKKDIGIITEYDCKNHLKGLKELHEELIKLWTNNQSKIPKLNY